MSTQPAPPSTTVPARPLLDVRSLTTSFAGGSNRFKVIEDVGFSVRPGSITGIVGESGSGKSISVKSVLGLVRLPGIVESGSAVFQTSSGPVDLLACPASRRRSVLATDIGYIIQNPFGALNPVVRIRKQFRTALAASFGGSKATLDDAADQALAQVGINDPQRVLDGFPHQLSGGMAQRVVIAIALARRPRLIVADEPTTALDLTVQRQILDIMAARAKELDASVLLITHDLGVVAHYCQEAFVFYRGKVVEHGTIDALFNHTRHPYTRRLIAASGGRKDTSQSEDAEWIS